MKARYKYISSPLIYLAVILISFLFFIFADWLVPQLHRWVNTVFGILPVYNEITSPEEFARQDAARTAVEAFVSLLVAEWLVSRIDNKRYEYVIEKTDGLYTMREGLTLYAREFLIFDLIFVSAVCAASVVACRFIPAVAFEHGAQYPLRLGYEMYTHHGAVTGALLLSAMAMLSRLISAFFSVRRYRAVWLSGGELL